MVAETIAIQRSLVPTPRAGLAPVGVVARRAVRGAFIWGAVGGLITWSVVSQFANVYPTAADRARAAAIYGSNVGLQALFGPVHHADTVTGYLAFHMIGLVGLIGAVWGLLTSTRLLRGEEEAGRWELLLAGPTTRRRAAASAVAGLGIGLLVLWATLAAVIVTAGFGPNADFSVSAGLFAALATVAPAAIFLAAGALFSQLAATRRQAAALTAGAFGVVYLVRLIAYSATSLRWLRWASPLAWVDELRPLTASRLPPLVPILATLIALVVLTIVLAGKRDLGASVLPASDTATPRTRLLNGPLGLAYRLVRRTAAGWIAGLAAGGIVKGLIAKSAAVGFAKQRSAFVQRLGGASGGAVFLGMTFLIVALLLGMVAAGQVAATREEESEGHLDHLLARPVARARWLAGRLVLSTAVLLTAGVAIGLFTWVGAASTGQGSASAGFSRPALTPCRWASSSLGSARSLTDWPPGSSPRPRTGLWRGRSSSRSSARRSARISGCWISRCSSTWPGRPPSPCGGAAPPSSCSWGSPPPPWAPGGSLAATWRARERRDVAAFGRGRSAPRQAARVRSGPCGTTVMLASRRLS